MLLVTRTHSNKHLAERWVCASRGLRWWLHLLFSRLVVSWKQHNITSSASPSQSGYLTVSPLWLPSACVLFLCLFLAHEVSRYSFGVISYLSFMQLQSAAGVCYGMPLTNYAELIAIEYIYLLCVFISLCCIIFSQRNIFMQRTDQEQTTQTALFSVNTVTPPPTSSTPDDVNRWGQVLLLIKYTCIVTRYQCAVGKQATYIESHETYWCLANVSCAPAAWYSIEILWDHL